VNATDQQLRMAAEVMRRVSALPQDMQRQRRVRLMLGAPQRRRQAFLIARPAMALGILLASVAGASAMVGGGWQYARAHITWFALQSPNRMPNPSPARATAHVTTIRAADRNESSSVTPAVTVAAADSTPAPANAVALPVAAPTPAVVAVEEPAPVESPVMRAPSVQRQRHMRRAEAKRRVARVAMSMNSEKPTAAAPASTHEPSTAGALPAGPGAELLIEAMEARREGSMTRAARLLAEYRDRYPNGALQEEALALSLEAAAVRGDSDAAYDFAQEYLRRFPGGRFRERVRQVMKTLPR
jgi:hypothetical protein